MKPVNTSPPPDSGRSEGPLRVSLRTCPASDFRSRPERLRRRGDLTDHSSATLRPTCNRSHSAVLNGLWMSANWAVMQAQTLYDDPALYDRLVPPGPCETFYDGLAPAGASVLELGCGTGRLTIPLARRGRSVTGLDASATMLSAARAKAAGSGTPICWTQGDMARFDLGRAFDVIIITCNSLAHLTTQKALGGCFASVRRHLANDGVFAFDVVNPDLKLLRRPIKERVKRVEAGSGVRLRETVRYDDESRIREAHWRVHDRDGSVHEVAFRLRQFLPDELPSPLRAAGLRLTARYGDFDRSPFRARSRLQVCLAAPA